MESKTDKQWAEYLNEAFWELSRRCNSFLQDKMRECAQGTIDEKQEIDLELAQSLDCESDIYRHMIRLFGYNEGLCYMIAIVALKKYDFDLFDEQIDCAAKRRNRHAYKNEKN